MKRLPTSNCCKIGRTQVDDPPKIHYRKSASSSTMRMHLISSALKTHSLSDPYPLVMGRSFVRLLFLLTGFSPYRSIPLSLGLYSQKPCPPILAGASRSGAEVWLSIKDAGSQCLPGFQCSTFELTSLSSLFPGLGFRDCRGDSCVYEDHRGNRMENILKI